MSYNTMAAASIPVKQWEDLTECPICTEVYTDPRVLPCIHTYCLKCIETWSKDKHPRNAVDCPLCRKEFTLPSNGARDLPKHFFIEKLLLARDLGNAESKFTPCDVCRYGTDEEVTTKTAKKYCLNCREKMCKSCAAVHERQSMSRSHKLIALGEKVEAENISALFKTSFCEKHPDKNLELYCFDCKLVVCMMCYVGVHNTHKCSGVNELAEEFSSQISGDVSNMETGAHKCREMLGSLRKEKDIFVDQITKIGNKILEALAEIKLGRTNEIDTLSEEVERRLLTLQSLTKYASEVKSKGAACHIAAAASSLHERADELLKFDGIEQSLDVLGHVDVTFKSTSDLVGGDGQKTVGEIFLKKTKRLPSVIRSQPSESSTAETVTQVMQQSYNKQENDNKGSEFSPPPRKKPRSSRKEEKAVEQVREAQLSAATNIAMNIDSDEVENQQPLQKNEPVDYTRDRTRVRQYITCSGCKKPRCIYSAKKLTAEQVEQLNLLMKDWKFRCGDGVPEKSKLEIAVVKETSCEDDVSFHYFFPKNDFPQVCYKCGSTKHLLPITEEMKEEYSAIHPVCRNCCIAGYKERTIKKRKKKKVPTATLS